MSGSQVEVNDIKNAFERGTAVSRNQAFSVFVLPCFITHCLSFFFPSSHVDKGEDPLAGDQNDHDMDSIAGVLKLYFRGLDHALFPKEVFHDLISCVCKCHIVCVCVRCVSLLGVIFSLCFVAAMESLQERAVHIKKVLQSLPSKTLIVMRYLFAFLNQ